MTQFSIYPTVALGTLFFLFSGCFPQNTKNDQRSYTDKAEASYAYSMEALEGEEYLEALRRFKNLRTKYPYSQYATLADLRIADVLLGQERNLEAAEHYRGFVQRHPTHTEVPYARYRLALCHKAEIPSDWWFLTPNYERDQGAAKEAKRYFEFFLQKHVDSEWFDDAKKDLFDVNLYLASHEFYVASFYIELNKPKGAINRLEGLLKAYPGSGFDAKALFLLAQCHLMLKDVEIATGYLRRITQEYPDDPLAEDAVSYLTEYNL